jgi:hypothetical protein
MWLELQSSGLPRAARAGILSERQGASLAKPIDVVGTAELRVSESGARRHPVRTTASESSEIRFACLQRQNSAVLGVRAEDPLS